MTVITPTTGLTLAASSAGVNARGLRLAADPAYQRHSGTLLFTDIVGYQEITRDYSDEELMAYMSQHRRLVRQIAEDFGGQLRNTFGDGLFVEFRQNSRDYDGHGERAIFAALNIFRNLPIEMPSHVGIHTGTYLEGNMDDGCHTQDLAGRDIIIASRCQTLKVNSGESVPDFDLPEGDRLIISAATYAAIGGTEARFDMQALGPVTLKGLDHATELYAVLEERPLESTVRLRAPSTYEEAANG